MRLMRETPGAQDHEREVLSSGLRVPTPVLPERPRPQPPAAVPEPSAPEPPAQPLYYEPEEAGRQPQPSAPPITQPPPPPPQFASQGWSPQQPPPRAAQPWGNQYQSPAPTTPIAPPQTPVAPLPWPGRNEAISVAALVTGCCAVTIMSALVAASLGAVLKLMLVLAILVLALGVTGLILALQKPSRFGGIPLAIAGLATGTAALVYYFTL